MTVDPVSLGRRRLLGWALAAPALLAACSRNTLTLNGSFIQLWQSHMDWSRKQWEDVMHDMRALGCREVVLQWVRKLGGPQPDWQVSDSTMNMLFDAATESGLRIRVGLPFDDRWWLALNTTVDGELAAFLQHSRDTAVDYVRHAPWATKAAFNGWYLPYEIEQYSWAAPERLAMLVSWLEAIAQPVQASTGETLPVSTYFSLLSTQGSLVDVWSAILDRAAIRPMVQDGVGVSGLGNLANVDPLINALRVREQPFDVIVELFEQLHATDGPKSETEFRAQSASWDRVQQQMQWAGRTGAAQIIAFAVTPWMTQADTRANALRQAWLHALS